MSIIPKLATSLNRRDEIPNQELAAEIVRLGDEDAVIDLFCGLNDLNKGVASDCIKVLYEIGYKDPKLIADYLPGFVEMLSLKNNRLQWGAMIVISCIVKERPGEVFAALPDLTKASKKGSVITRDNFVNILISLSAIAEYSETAFSLLLKQLQTCPTNQLPMYAERAMPIINASNREQFVHVLFSRIGEIEKESGKKRVEKVVKKIG